jgi:hypothetical protein
MPFLNKANTSSQKRMKANSALASPNGSDNQHGKFFHRVPAMPASRQKQHLHDSK